VPSRGPTLLQLPGLRCRARSGARSCTSARGDWVTRRQDQWRHRGPVATARRKSLSAACHRDHLRRGV